jgi:hypothetical protein
MYELHEDHYIAVDCLQVTFDDEYGYPKRIDNAACVDPDRGMGHGITEVISFEVIDSVSSPAPPKEPLSNDQEKRWLQGIPCRLPCWEGVTPGITNAEEAFEALKRSPMSSWVSLRRYSDSERGRLSWYEPNGNYGGDARFYLTEPEIIYEVTPNIKGGPNVIRALISLGEIIAGYGEPTDVVTTRLCGKEDTAYLLEFLYRPQGIYLVSEYYSEYYGETVPAVDANLPIEEIYLFNPGEGFRLYGSDERFRYSIYEESRAHADSIFIKGSSWQGFQDFHSHSQTDPNTMCP